MSDAVAIAVITVIPSTLAALGTLWVAVRVNKVSTDVREVHIATNSMKDQLVEATALASEAKGRDDERANPTGPGSRGNA